jgi:ubiquitin C-terminal hydrolase
LEKKSTIKKLPNTLIIHLSRIIFDFDILRLVKINDRFEFPNVLNLKNMTTEEVMKRDQKNFNLELKRRKQSQAEKVEDGKEEENYGVAMEEVTNNLDEVIVSDEEESSSHVKQETEDKQEKDDQDFEYKLVGIVCHMGSAEAGHYLSYINVERDKETEEGMSREKWLETESQTWLEFNDSSVYNFNFQQNLEKNCFGGGNN